jgi:hypothetical protein
MTRNHKERFIDDLLDSGLRQYGQADPREGLENRILAGMHAATPARSQAWTSQYGLAVLATVLLVTIGVFTARVKRIATPAPIGSQHSPVDEKPPQPVPVIVQPSHESVKASVSQHQAHRLAKSELVKQEQFPSPQPLSEQEAMLAQYIEQFPGQARLMAQAQTQLSKEEALEMQSPDADFADPEQENR